MLDLFIELTNQIFWDGYAQELSVENPEVFRFTLDEFIKSYNLQKAPRLTGNRAVSLRSTKRFLGKA